MPQGSGEPRAKLESGPIPLYHQLERHLVNRIAIGEFDTGTPLPSEEQIGRCYGVSRITVRKALDALLRQGLIMRRRGVGSFVTKRRSDVHLIHLTGSLDDFLQAANQTKGQIISLATVKAPDQIAETFSVEPRSTLLRLELVSHGGDLPIAHCEFYFPKALIGKLTEAELGGSEVIMRIVERLADVRINRVSQVIDAALAGPTTARYLGIPQNTPVLNTKRVYFTTSGVPIQIARVQLHPTRYRYEVELLSNPHRA